MTAIFKSGEPSAVIDGRGKVFVLQEPNVAAALPGPPGPAGPSGPGGPAATVAVGTTTTGAAGSSASVTNAGTSSAAVLDFTIPRGSTGAQGAAATVAVGTTTTGAAGSSASVTNVGTTGAAVFNFSIPRGATGAQGAAATITVGTVTTGAPGSAATVTNAGTTGAAVFNFSIPRGADGVGAGTVTSVAASGGSTGLTFSGGPITESGILTLGGELNLSSIARGVDGMFLVGRITETGATGRVGVSTSRFANTVALRGTGGTLLVGEPTQPEHAATQFYVTSNFQALSGKNVANGYAGLGADGKINGSQLPALAISETFPVSSQSAMLALTAQVGDVAVRTDTSQSFILRVEPASTLANWTQLLVPGGGVTSVGASGGTTGFGFTGGPITSTGTLTLTVTDQTIARAALGLGSIATLAAPSGDVVGTSGAQTLANKTLAAPVVNGYTEGLATASGTAFAPSLAEDTIFFYTTTGNATVTMPPAVQGKSLLVVVEYGGAHSLAWAGTSIRWAGGTAPTPTSVSGKRDTFPFFSADGVVWQNGGINA